jgi:hypothetical protein
MEAALRVAGQEIRYRARVSRRYSAAAPVLAVQSTLGHLFFDMLVHRARGIAEGQVEANEIRVSIGQEQNQVVVDISDTGPPLPPEDRAASLPVSRHLAAVLGGRLSVATEATGRTQLCLQLPAFAQGLQPNISCARRPAAGSRRGAILVVVDDPLMGKALRRMFEAEHEVVAVESAREALEKIGAGEPVRLSRR